MKTNRKSARKGIVDVFVPSENDVEAQLKLKKQTITRNF